MDLARLCGSASPEKRWRLCALAHRRQTRVTVKVSDYPGRQVGGEGFAITTEPMDG